MAYYDDGRPKRTNGVWYPDIGMTWTQELAEEWGNDYDDDIVRQKKLERSQRKTTEVLDTEDRDSDFTLLD